MLVCAGSDENIKNAIPIGIGMQESAINLTKIITQKKKIPEKIVFIGSAGSYGRASIMKIYESSLSSNLELSFLDKNSYSPIENAIGHKSNLKITVNSSNYITTSQKHSKMFINLNIDLENMEFFSVMKTASLFNITCYGIFIITNYCDQNAHNDFIKNHKEAKIKLEEYITNRNNG